MKLFLLSTLFSLIIISGCTCHTYTTPATAYDYSGQPYSYIQSDNGQQMVVVRDNNGAQVVMEYMLFQSLMNNGGYGSVINYYHVHPKMFHTYDRSYSSWRPFRGTSYNTRTSGFRSTVTSPGVSYRSTTVTPKGTGFRAAPTYTKPSGSGFRSGSSYSGFRSSPTSGFRSSSFRSGRH